MSKGSFEMNSKWLSPYIKGKPFNNASKVINNNSSGKLDTSISKISRISNGDIQIFGLSDDEMHEIIEGYNYKYHERVGIMVYDGKVDEDMAHNAALRDTIVEFVEEYIPELLAKITSQIKLSSKVSIPKEMLPSDNTIDTIDASSSMDISEFQAKKRYMNYVSSYSGSEDDAKIYAFNTVMISYILHCYPHIANEYHSLVYDDN